MELSLRNICKKVGNEEHIRDVSLTLHAGTLNILLGPTLSGKTSLMRLMAGLDKPSSGALLLDGVDITGTPIQKRNVAMVYQQFINYPNFTVYENIASPLRLAKVAPKEIDGKVHQFAELLKLTPMLNRLPAELSGGQQQRTALARALVKGADLVLLDEPLANLDYKLREELREEFPKIFAATGAIFVYATTEPSEALLLGGNIAPLHEGQVTQFGPTIDVYRKPENLITIKTFSDPPPNIMPVVKNGNTISCGKLQFQAAGAMKDMADGNYTIAFRPHRLYRQAEKEGMLHLKGKVAVSEITGSESFIHITCAEQRWVALLPGVHNVEIDAPIELYLSPEDFYIFDQQEQLVVSPQRN